jgi:hypothetical protein
MVLQKRRPQRRGQLKKRRWAQLYESIHARGGFVQPFLLYLTSLFRGWITGNKKLIFFYKWLDIWLQASKM